MHEKATDRKAKPVEWDALVLFLLVVFAAVCFYLLAGLLVPVFLNVLLIASPLINHYYEKTKPSPGESD